MIDPDAMSADELDLDICLSFCGPPAQTSMAHTRFKRRGNQPFLVTVDFRSTDVIISAREPVMVMVLLLGLALRLATLASLKQGGFQRLQRTDTFMMRLH